MREEDYADIPEEVMAEYFAARERLRSVGSCLTCVHYGCCDFYCGGRCWEWTTLVAAWRYYEHGHTIASAMFPSDMLRRFWGEGNPYSDEVRDTIANQFAKIDHGGRGEEDWTMWLKKDKDGSILRDDCDAKVWTTFYQFCKGWVDGFVEVTARNGKVQKTVKAFYTEYTDCWTPVDGYIAHPLLSPYIPKEFIVSKKGETK